MKRKCRSKRRLLKAFELIDLTENVVADMKNLVQLLKVFDPVSEEQDAHAAVAVILRRGKRDWDFLFVKRVENPADPWSGQMAFPGGKRALNDGDLKQTVVRETLEETNIDLLDKSLSLILGVMPPLRSTQKPEMLILPFVTLLQKRPSIKLQRRELTEYVWISAETLIRNKSTVKFDFGEFPAYVVEGRVIWGLTFRILEALFSPADSKEDSCACS